LKRQDNPLDIGIPEFTRNFYAAICNRALDDRRQEYFSVGEDGQPLLKIRQRDSLYFRNSAFRQLQSDRRLPKLVSARLCSVNVAIAHRHVGV